MATTPLHIGVIAPPWVPVPPVAYGGTELVLDTLCTGLRAAGHDVTLFTTADSTCPVTRRWLFDHSDPDRMGAVVLALRHAAAAYDALHGVDIVHDHTLAGLFIGPTITRTPIVATNHGPFDIDLADLFSRVSDRIPLIAISHDQARRAPSSVRVRRVIHHGVDLDQYPFGDGDGGYVLFLGRMSPSKGVDVAIRAARAAGRPIVIAAKMREPGEHRYFRERVQPLLGRDATYVGEAGFADKVRLLRSAIALVNPIAWPEPFGMVMIEALATGTPVVAFPSGAAPEIIDDGSTGRLVTNEADLARAIRDADRFDRSACRNAALARFSRQRMVRDHVALYRDVLAGETAHAAA